MIGFESRLENDEVADKMVCRAGEERLVETFIPESELLDMNWKEIGVSVTEPRDREYRELAYKVATICRRSFFAYDAVLISRLDAQLNGDAGIAFTSNAIYYWTEGDVFGFMILYKDIEEVDYSPEGVLITVAGESAEQMRKVSAAVPNVSVKAEAGNEPEPFKAIRTLYCTGSAAAQGADTVNIIRNMYNFIADIVDYGRSEH